MKLELKWPVSYVSINQKFGVYNPIYTNLGITYHNGLDLYAPDGTPVYASHDGIITFAGDDGSAGLGIVIRTLIPYFYDTEKQEFISEEEAIKRGYIE